MKDEGRNEKDYNIFPSRSNVMLLHISKVHVLLQRKLMRILSCLVLVPLPHFLDRELLAVFLGLDGDDCVQEFLSYKSQSQQRLSDLRGHVQG